MTIEKEYVLTMNKLTFAKNRFRNSGNKFLFQYPKNNFFCTTNFSKYGSRIELMNKKYVSKAVSNTKKWTDDITRMNGRPIDKIFYPHELADLQEIIKTAQINKKKISMRGQSHTMGGHTINEDGYIIDMKYLNRIKNLDKKNNLVTVEPGICWHSLIKFLNEHGLSPMTLQSYANFSVGGSASVNAHGITNNDGLYKSIKEFKILDPKGNLLTCNENQNSQLNSLVIGGYGLFGIITEMTLKVVPNVGLKMESKNLKIDKFIEEFKKVVKDPFVNIKLGRLDTVLFNNVTLYQFEQNGLSEIISKLAKTPNELTKSSQLIYKWLLPTKKGQQIRQLIEKVCGKPADWSEKNERNELLYETSVPLAKLYNPIIELDRTHVLQEYFISPEKSGQWTTYLKNYFSNQKLKKVSLLNCTVRYVNEDSKTFLNYAKKDMLSFVFYYRLPRTLDADKELEKINIDLINETLKLDGTFYLPYRHHYNEQQLNQSYPEISEFFQYKNQFDPEKIFTNMWYDHYGKNNINSSNVKLNELLYDEISNVNEKINNIQQNYKMIYESDIQKYKLKMFFENIFNIIPPNEMNSLLNKIMEENPNASDLEVFKKIKNHVENKNFLEKLKLKYRSFKVLSEQRKDFSTQIENLYKHLNYDKINGYVSIGDAGRCVNTLKDKLQINGPIYIVHDKQSPLDIIERGSLFPVGKFIKFDYKEVNDLNIPNESISLVTCLMGLHHFPTEKLPTFLKSIHRIMKDDGIFIFREHNAYQELLPIVTCAHNSFNAITGVSLEEEETEIRAFRTIQDWKKLLKENGFEDTEIYDIQSNDPTEDYLMGFKKIIPKEKLNKKEIDEYIIDNKINYKRNSNRTYQTLVEWYLVDLVKQMGNFMDHTPYFSFPYLKTIKQMWELYFKETEIVRKKNGFKSAYLSSDNISYLAICGTTSLIFSLMSCLSFLPRKIFTLPFILADTHIQLVISHPNDLNLEKEDKRIQINKSIIDDQKSISLITIPRYKTFKDIIIELAKKNVKFEEIAGQKSIQIKVKVNNLEIIENLNKMNGCNVLLNYQMLNGLPHEVAIDVKISELSNVINNLEQKNILIDHIFDF